jgi:predicted Rossmann-fold nucleotide-binding protein
VQTKKVTRFPVVLIGTAYWRGLLDWLRSTMIEEGKIGTEDLDLLFVTDDVDAAVQHIVDADRALDSRPAASARRTREARGE